VKVVGKGGGDQRKEERIVECVGKLPYERRGTHKAFTYSDSETEKRKGKT